MNDDSLPQENQAGRRRHTSGFKRQVLAECRQPGVSVAAVALRHGINQNMIYTWRRAVKLSSHDEFLRLPSLPAVPPSDILEPASAAESTATVCIELQIPSGQITVQWPIDSITLSTKWIKALMR